MRSEGAETASALQAREWVQILPEVSRLVENLITRLDCFEQWPLTINQSEYENAYTASFYNTYITYLAKELGPLPTPARLGLRALLRFLGALLRVCRVNQVVQLNNWLLSTNPVPPEFPSRWPQLLELFPNHALIFRSLNEGFHMPLLQQFRARSWQLLPSRIVYLFDGSRPDFLRKDDVRRDRKLLTDGRFQWLESVNFEERHWLDVASLYQELYRGKYPTENPAFTAEFFRLCAQRLGWRILLLLDHRGESVGVTGWWLRHGILIGTVVGYRLALPRQWGLYRRLMTRVLLEAAELGVWLNMSSGAGPFKRSRGGVPTLEFMAVYHRHLPAYRRLPFQVLGRLLGQTALGILRRYA
ncbi:MAG: GNAT family N-acetyltransferase [Vulcanimicrobiota bacterium]